MKHRLVILLVLFALWMATGFYIIGGNQKGVVRRLGSLVTHAGNRPVLKESGWHYDWPWPMSAVDRVNLNEVRTLTIGREEPLDVEPLAFLVADDVEHASRFLTGDKNILHVQISVQYRVSEANVDDWLYNTEDPVLMLRQLSESMASELFAQSGVDFVHPLGLAELRLLLTERVRQRVHEQQLGIDIEEVSIASVYPPLQVKSWFVDVANARADQHKAIQTALAHAQNEEQRGRAVEQKTWDAATIERHQTLQKAKSSADRFRKLVGSFTVHGSASSESYQQARTMMLQRYYIDTVEDLLSRVKNKIVLEGEQPADITLFGNRSQNGDE